MSQSRNVMAALYDRRAPNSALFRMPNGDVITTAQARAKVKRFASALVACGIRAGDRVSLRLPKSTDGILLAQACLWIGAILHPLNDAYTANEVGNLLKDAKSALFVTSP